jgi:hypothetical protein
MNVIQPGLNQVAFLNGFLGAPIVPEGARISATPGASEFQISRTADGQGRYRALVLLTNRGLGSKAVYEIASDPAWRTFFSFPCFGESFFLTGDAYATRYVHLHGDGVRAMALAVFPDFEAADLEDGDTWQRRNRADLFEKAKIDELRTLLDGMGVSDISPERAFEEGRTYSRRLINYLYVSRSDVEAEK